MNYREKVAYLMQVKEMNTNDSEIKRREQIVGNEVLEFEESVFLVLEKEIQNEKMQIEFLTHQLQTTTDEMFKAYCESEIDRHRKNITNYGNQIYSLFFREKIIDILETRKNACTARIDYNQKQLEIKPEDKVAKISLKNSEQEQHDINYSLDLLNGRSIDLIDSYINISEIGKKIG